MVKKVLFSLVAAVFFAGIMFFMSMTFVGELTIAIMSAMVGFIGTLSGCSIGIMLSKVFEED